MISTIPGRIPIAEIFSFNQGVDEAVLVPVAKTYRTVLPPPMRQSLHDFMQNLDGPVIFANDLLQGQVKLAGDTLARLVLNTTVGVGRDVRRRDADRNSLSHQRSRHYLCGLGLCRRSLRHRSGSRPVEPARSGRAGRRRVCRSRQLRRQRAPSAVGRGDARPSLPASTRARATSKASPISRRTALDNYATIRSLFRQRREAQIRHEKSNLPNPSPVQGGDDTPASSISYSIAK